MSTATQYDILLKTLRQTQNQSFSVVSIRDLIIKSHPDDALDPARLRRWIYGRFQTFIKKGLLQEEAVSNSKKKLYALTPAFSGIKATTPNKPLTPTLNTTLNNQLTGKAKAYERELTIQLGEVAEYQKLSNEHPALKPNLDKKSKRLTEENYRLLGRLKAIEETLNGRDEPSCKR